MSTVMTFIVSSPPRERQPVRVTDLPTEILCQIFDHFKDARMERPGRVDWFWHNNYDDLDIKRAAVLNSRLACRRLREIASPMVLPTVRVKLEQASLDRLDEISRIPEIARSVRGIEVILAYRSKELAADLGKFVARRKLDIKDIGDLRPSRADLEEAWDEYLKDPSIDTSGNEHQALLRESHHEYQRRHDEQNRLVNSGEFVDAIVSAVSRMPLFGSLLFDDHDIYAGYLTREEREAPSLRLIMTAADRWSALEAVSDKLPPARILSDLPVAIHGTGVLLREVGVSTFPRTAHVESPVIRDAESLRAACQGLEEVNFWPLDAGSYTATALEQLNWYLGALVSGRSLELLLVNAKENTQANTTEKSAIGPALSTFDGAHLKKIHLDFARFTQSEWDAFCDGLGNHLDDLSVSDVGITDGSWGPSIRVLRQKTASRCDEGLCEVSLYRLTGGEFGDGSSDVILNWWDPQRNQEFML